MPLALLPHPQPAQLLPPPLALQSIIDRGELVPDHMVLDALLEVVLNPEVGVTPLLHMRMCTVVLRLLLRSWLPLPLLLPLLLPSGKKCLSMSNLHMLQPQLLPPANRLTAEQRRRGPGD